MVVGHAHTQNQAILWWIGLRECLENGLDNEQTQAYTKTLLRMRIVFALAGMKLMDEASERMAKMWIAAADRAAASGVKVMTLTDGEAKYFETVFRGAEVYFPLVDMRNFIVAVERTTD